MKNIYSGVILLVILVTSVFLMVSGALLSSNVADAHAMPTPHTQEVRQGIHAPLFPEEEAYRSHRAQFRAFHKKDCCETLKEKIEKREKKIEHLEKEIDALEQKMVEALRQKMRAIEKDIIFLSRNQDNDTDHLSYGDRSPDVRSLQIFLNQNGFALAANGFGAPGEETDYFGPRTLRALRLFQGSRGIPVSGVLDGATSYTIDVMKAAEEDPAPEKDLTVQDEGKPRRTLVSFLKQFFRSLFGERAVSEHE